MQIKNLFKKIQQREPSKSLFEKIIKNIESERNFIILRRKIILISVSMTLSTVLFIFSVLLIRSEAIKSGFALFFSLIFSDFNIVMQHWQNFGVSLLETIPIMNIVLSLFIGTLSISSIKLFSKAIKIFNNYKQIHNYKYVN